MNTKLNHLPGRTRSHRPPARSTIGNLGLLFGLAVAASAQAEPRAGAFQMLVAEDSVTGQHLIEGDIDAALAQGETRSLNRFSALNDRCVSLTLNRELERAEVVCNDAVREARRSGNSGSPGRGFQGTEIDPRSRRAMALTNRGVLYALQGRGELARGDFDAAVMLNARLAAAEENLAILDARPSMAGID
jgi:hypothetical protein